MMDLGFPRSRRLKKQREFRLVYRSGRKTTNEYLSIYSRPVEGRGGKVGVVAGKRLGKAVERNRIRRVIKEVFRTNQRRITRKADIAIVVRRPALELSHRDLADQVLQLLRHAELMDA